MTRLLKHDLGRKRMSRALGATTLTLLLTASVNAPAGDANPYLEADDSWITISGSVKTVQADRFVLDYGDGEIIVQMDDGDRDADGYQLIAGDKVTVTGQIDDDFFELTTIEAGSVYVENLGTTFFASTLDEEAKSLAESPLAPKILISQTAVTGTVSGIEKDEFLIDTGKRILRVDVSEMSFDPLDDEGYLKIDSGDRVRVFGTIDVNLFEGRRLEADTIVVLHQS